MNSTTSSYKPWMIALILVCSIVVITSQNAPVMGNTVQRNATNANSSRYTVNHTEGTNLIVTDNQSNTLYFYTIDADGKPGDDLVLRGTADLNQVGQQVIKPTLINPKKK